MLTRHQVLLYEGQFERLNEIYSSRSASEVIRQLVDNHLKLIEQRLKEQEDVKSSTEG